MYTHRDELHAVWPREHYPSERHFDRNNPFQGMFEKVVQPGRNRCVRRASTANHPKNDPRHLFFPPQKSGDGPRPEPPGKCGCRNKKIHDPPAPTAVHTTPPHHQTGRINSVETTASIRANARANTHTHTPCRRHHRCPRRSFPASGTAAWLCLLSPFSHPSSS